MAHVLLAMDSPPLRSVYTLLLADADHQIMAPGEFWGILATLRSTLHPLVVVYIRDECVGRLLPDAERMAALEASRADLRHHRYVAVAWNPAALPPRLAAIEDALDVELLVQPFPLEALAAAVQRTAQRLPQ